MITAKLGSFYLNMALHEYTSKVDQQAALLNRQSEIAVANHQDEITRAPQQIAKTVGNYNEELQADALLDPWDTPGHIAPKSPNLNIRGREPMKKKGKLPSFKAWTANLANQRKKDVTSQTPILITPLDTHGRLDLMDMLQTMWQVRDNDQEWVFTGLKAIKQEVKKGTIGVEYLSKVKKLFESTCGDIVCLIPRKGSTREPKVTQLIPVEPSISSAAAD